MILNSWRMRRGERSESGRPTSFLTTKQYPHEHQNLRLVVGGYKLRQEIEFEFFLCTAGKCDGIASFFGMTRDPDMK